MSYNKKDENIIIFLRYGDALWDMFKFWARSTNRLAVITENDVTRFGVVNQCIYLIHYNFVNSFGRNSFSEENKGFESCNVVEMMIK